MPADVRKTGDGSLTLFSERYQETYHSDMGAAREARELYLVKSGLLTSLELAAPPFSGCILDVGLGLGYNAMSAIEAFFTFAPAESKLRLISLEMEGHLVELMFSGKAPWQQSWPQAWLNFLQAGRRECESPNCLRLSLVHLGKKVDWDILIGDATQTLGHHFQKPKCSPINYIFQDAFSPKKNPELWTSSWFGSLYQYVDKKSVLVTYSVARSVKDALTQAGWVWATIPGVGQKKQWLIAHPAQEKNATLSELG